MSLSFRNGYKASKYCTADASDKYFAVEHNSWGKWSEVIESSDDLDYLKGKFTDDLANDDGDLDAVTSIFGVKPRFEILTADELGVEEVDEDDDEDDDD